VEEGVAATNEAIQTKIQKILPEIIFFKSLKKILFSAKKQKIVFF